MDVLQTTNLSKNFGKLKAVNNLNLTIEEGKVFGILGPNGSGKTTTLGMVLGVTSASSGSYSWFGQGNDHQVRKQIGAILERPIFYPYMNAQQNLELNAAIRNIGTESIDKVLDMVGLLHRKNDPFKGYSLGMKQRLAIGAAMLCDPKVLVLDEPTNGLDPEGIADVRQIIYDIAAMGKSIIIASHLLYEVQKVCDEFCVLRLGNLIHQGPVDGFSEQSKVELASPDMSKLREALANVMGISQVIEKGKHLEITGSAGFNAAEMNAKLYEHGVTLSHLQVLEQSLEDQFLKILKENDGPTV